MPERTRIYCGYDGNTNETTTLQNVWSIFPFPSTGFTTWRTAGPVTISGSSTTFTWNDKPSWVEVIATCNIKKGSGGNTNRNVEFVWYQNGSPAGPIRGTYMNNQDCQIISGHGYLYLNTGDTIEPWIRNVENDDKILLTNCTFILSQDDGW